MAIPFERCCQKSEQAMVAGHFLYINFIMDCPTMSNCGTRCWEQAGEEQIIPCESKLAACGSGENSGIEGALHHVPAIALTFCLWKAEYVHLCWRAGRAAGKGSKYLHQFQKPHTHTHVRRQPGSPSGARNTASLPSTVQPVEVCREVAA